MTRRSIAKVSHGASFRCARLVNRKRVHLVKPTLALTSEYSDLAEQAKANSTAGQFANGDYQSVLPQAIIRALESHHSMSEQALQNPKVFEEIADLLLPEVYEKARG